MKEDKIKIVIVEASDIIKEGLLSILNHSTRFHVVETFVGIAKLQEKCLSIEIKADVLIVNPTLISHEKQGALRALFPQAYLIALLYNYINKEALAPFDISIEIYDKRAKILHKLEQAINDKRPVKAISDAADLSEREKEILTAVAKGMMNKEVADLYNISIHTVMAHRKNISRKTGIKSVSGFVVYALLNNFIEDHEIL